MNTMGLSLIFLLCSGSAAIRLGTDPVDGGKQIFTVTVEMIPGPALPETTTTMTIFKNGEAQGDLEKGEPKVFSGYKGDLVTVGTDSDNAVCSYQIGRQMTVCFLQEMWRVVFKSQQEVEETLKLGVLVTRKGFGTGPPFDVEIKGVTHYSDAGTLAERTTWWGLYSVDDGVMATVLFPRTGTRCTYYVAMDNKEKQTCEADGMEAEFETMISKPYIYNWTEVVKKKNVPGWKAHILIEGKGPQFNIFLDDELKYTVGPFAESTFHAPKLFDAKLDQTVKLVFGGNENEQNVHTYKVGDEQQTFQNLEGYTIDFETIPKGKSE